METDENGKPKVPIGDIDTYALVMGEVRDFESLFSDSESVTELGDPMVWVRKGFGIKMEFLPCSLEERMFHKCDGWEYFYVYTTLFLDLGVRFLFTQFQCGVLSQLKCDPTQVHPNAWGFMRAFEVLMEYLEQEPELEVFFSYFQAKGVRKGGLVALTSCQRRVLFSLYKQSYKDFKSMYVKVRSLEEEFPFYLDECLLERFLLYWYSEPVQILGMKDVNEQNALVIKPLVVGKLLKWEKERESVFDYIETTTGGLKNYFKAKSEREFSASNAVKVEKGVVVNQPSKKKKGYSMKRRRAEEGGSGKGKAIDLTVTLGKTISLEEVKGITEKQKVMHGYVAKEDLTSVWSEHFPISVVAEEHFQSKMGLELIDSVDGVTRAQFLQVYAARLLCLGRYEELKAREETEQKKGKSLEVQRALEAERRLQVVTEQLDGKEKEMVEMKADVESLKGKLQKLEKDKTQLEARVAELCVERKELEQSREDHGYDMMAARFERAQKQAQFFYPSIKFDQLNPIKVVHKGALVDDDEVDLEDGDDHNPE
ncbi:hypothetical protein PIB30_016942 [Stylosanthes scabra]|uniref:Transposase (Putative), gypsy type n=1 Tax=Stylosanthes scabra TaxID=79078 RepID=A0ABU6Y7U8_9FABA|nr:hypothetical protein [Stylosanthes scabra]